MKKLILLFTIITSFNVQAKQPADCDALAELAVTVMGARQRGYTMRQMFEVSDNNVLLNYMISQAFETSSLVQGVTQKQAEIVKFENLIFLTCHQLNELNKGE